MKGLRILYTNNGGTNISAKKKKILSLIYKNKSTLEILYADISSVTETELWELYSTYPDFMLDNIKKTDILVERWNTTIYAAIHPQHP